MALATVWRNLCHSPNLRVHGALAALKRQPGHRVHKGVQACLCPWFCPLRPAPSQAKSLHTCCEKVPSENGNDPHPLQEPEFSQVACCDRLEGNAKIAAGAGRQLCCRRLSKFASSQEVLSFLSTLQAVPEPLATGALQRICEVESRRGDSSLPQEILDNGVFEALCLPFEQEPSSLSSAGLVSVLRALALLRVVPQGRLLPSLVAECRRRLQRDGLDVQALCVLGESLLKLQGPDCSTLELVLDELQGRSLESVAAEDLVALYRTLQACPEKAGSYQGLLDKVNTACLSVFLGLSPTSISQVLDALVVLDQSQALSLVIRLAKYARRHVPAFTGQELGKVIEALAYFGHSDGVFTEALEQRFSTASLTPDPELLCRAVQYCSRRRVLSRPILDSAAEAFVCRPHEFSPRQVAELIEPFGRLNYSPPNATALFRSLESELATRFRDFPPRALLNLLHSCSLIERHPTNLMAKIFSPYFLMQLQGEEPFVDRLSLAQLTHLLLTSFLECPFYKGPRLPPKFQVKSFLTPCCALETPMDFHLYNLVKMALIKLLGSRLYFGVRVLTPYNYTIDVELKLNEEGFILPFRVEEDIHKRVALCLDDARRFCLNSRHLLGKEAAKQRQLRLLGYHVVQIPYYEVELLKSRLEMVGYLQRKLFSPGTGIH